MKGAAFTHGASQAQRLLRRWGRTPLVYTHALVFPVFLLLVFRLVFGDTMTAASDGDSLRRYVPLATLVGTVFGGVGYALGFRPDDPAVLPLFVLIPVPAGIGFSALVCAVAVRASSVSALSGLSILFLLMLFVSTGFAPLESYPQALRPVVHVLPLSCGVDTMRGLAGSGAVLAPLL
jgi:ABC-2 type transport system permease protein